MTNTLSLSRRIVAALVERGVEVPQEWTHSPCPRCFGRGAIELWDGSNVPARMGGRRCNECDGKGKRPSSNYPDLAAPENLHLLYAVADSLGSVPCATAPSLADGMIIAIVASEPHQMAEAPTRSLAVLAALCAALGIEQ